MKKSISFKMFWTIFIVIGSVLLLAWISINFFADDFYYNQKMRGMDDAWKKIEGIFADNTDLEIIEKNLDELAAAKGENIFIYDEEGNLFYGDFYPAAMGQGVSQGMGHNVEPNTSHGKGQGRGKDQGQTITNQIDQVESNLGDDGVYISIDDNSLGNVDRYMYARTLENDYLLILQTPMQAIDETIDIIKQILVYMFLLAFLLALIGAYLLSRNLTKPLIELNRIATEMRRLNFSMKYRGKREDEIGELGYTLNDLTDQLESTIMQLKTELDKEKNLEIMRKKFVAQVSHELQTPITVIKGYVEALQDGMVLEEEEQLYYYNVVQDETSKMSHMIRDLLDLSQLEAGMFQINKVIFDLDEMMEKLSGKYKTLGENQGITMQWSKDNQPKLILGDAMRLQQVLENFIQNAFKYSKYEKKIKIDVINGMEKIKVQIFNTGDALSGEDLQYIWESFYKGNHSKKGVGLGLAIAKNILILHHANYGVGNVDRGVEFWFELDKYNE